ncbi:hypothetical protein FHR83_006427 [Actinoplanes campanulatus]|uniref:Uncharacterized protein n=1 Tax=Actinoplanes campanulatus TaxID=113559 RepID=A0A7W5AM02_9ACTN|nr:hypothetical protein [Actinoplanes campanulatus]MBB3098728.1 hypothetical protein [Actinoplanes campanulatus]GGN37328.1 hypothetical protein GCM10010109_63180 [Actinoplanes campanulatus]GID40769.1 hypothetical protein Aca09nite_72750 [Actinoplanes campanulatus]
MRFFSNEANETDETGQTDQTDQNNQAKEHDGADGTAPRPVPQQRAGSPWQRETGPDQQPVAVGTSAVGDDPERTDRIPTAAAEPAADRTVAFEDGTAKADTADAEDDVHKDDAAVDQAIEDRRTFDDPHLTPETDSAVDDPRPAAEKPLSGPVALFPGGDVESLRERWRDIQLRFVDDPKAATGEAAGLVDEAVDKLAKALRDHRGSLSTGTDETEALRVELRSYRDILDRLLGL